MTVCMYKLGDNTGSRVAFVDKNEAVVMQAPMVLIKLKPSDLAYARELSVPSVVQSLTQMLEAGERMGIRANAKAWLKKQLTKAKRRAK